MKDYNLRFSFTAVGEEGIAQLKAFRDRLVDLDSKALSQVYREFDIAPLQITPEDAVTDISIVHVTHADKFYWCIFPNSAHEKESKTMPHSYRHGF